MSTKNGKIVSSECAGFENQHSMFNTRRGFLVKSSTAVAGLALFSSPIGKAAAIPVAQRNGFLDFLGKFAMNVGFNLASLYIYDYLKSRFGNQGYPVEQYDETQNRGYFHNPGWRFYSPRNYGYRGSNEVIDQKVEARRFLKAGFQRGQAAYPPYPYVFYPWMNNDRLNAVAQFQNFGNRFSTCLAAPTIIGLSLAADEMSNMRIGVKPILLPYCQTEVSNGTYQETYRQPDRYCSEDGKVTVDYQTDGQGTGQVEVIYRGKPQVGKLDYFKNNYGVKYA
jgi:hypothetical protein